MLLLSYGPAGRSHGRGHMGAIACFSPSHRWGVSEHLSFLKQPRRASARPHGPQPHLSWGSKQNYLAIGRKSVFLFLAPWGPELCVWGVWAVVYIGPLSAGHWLPHCSQLRGVPDVVCRLDCEWRKWGWSYELSGELDWSGSKLCPVFCYSIGSTFLSLTCLGFNDTMVIIHHVLFGHYFCVMVVWFMINLVPCPVPFSWKR